MWKLFLASTLIICIASTSLFGQDVDPHATTGADGKRMGDQQNFDFCLHGQACNHNLLTREQFKQVRKVEEKKNYEACKKGESCNHAFLSKSHYAKIHKREIKRNLESCLNGKSCNHALLTAAQSDQVRQAETAKTKQ